VKETLLDQIQSNFPGEMKSASEEDIMKETTGQGLKINNFDLQGFLTAEDNDSEEPTLQEVKALKMRVKNLLEAKNALRDMEDRKKTIDSLQMKLSQVEQENVELQLLLDTQKKKFSELEKLSLRS
jgi:DNA-binding transcriptional regulator GbsR (MarR family)